MKVFLGATPGVGKIYVMPQIARRLKNEGVNVVTGLAETHGRAEIRALLERLEVLPCRLVDYRDHAEGLRPGASFGRSICRGLIGAMGGTIVGQSPAVGRRDTRLVIRDMARSRR